MSDHFEVAIVGAGPAGLGAAANAAEHKLSHVLIERKEVGNTIFDYQKKKYVMAEPTRLPLRGKMPFDAGSREEVLDDWNKTIASLGINVHRGEVTKIEKRDDVFHLTYGQESCTAKYVILGIGVQGTPRKLGVPGEDAPHVMYTLSDPDEFEGKNVLVVGAGDSAIENALALYERNNVAILNRSAEFARAKDANIAKINDAIKAKKITLYANAAVHHVEAETTVVTTPEGEVPAPCNVLIARLGGILPRKFLEAIGIRFSGPDPSAIPVVNGRYETSVPNLFVLGALIGYPLIKQALNQGYEVIEHIVGNPVEPADQGLLEEKLRVLPGSIAENLALIQGALPLFNELSEAQIRELIIDSTVHVKRPGDEVFHVNEYTDSFWSVVRGSVGIAIGKDKIVPIEPGNFFGEMGLLSGRRRSATVNAHEPSILLETPRKQILKLISAVPSVKKALDEAFMVRAFQTSIFPEADPAFLRLLVAKIRMKSVKKNEVLFREGDIGDAAYVIRKGSIKISRKNARGIEVTQTYLSAGNIFGEMALIDEAPAPRSATVTAAVGCELLLIEKVDFRNLLDLNPEVKKRITQLAHERQVQNLTHQQSQYHGKLLDFMLAEGVTDAENFLLIDSDLCVGCDNCEKACAATHSGYSRLDRKGGKTFACVQIPISCRHCENPLCMTDCPPDALTRMPNGEVLIKDSCIGCGNCTRNCPYGVIQLVYDKPGIGYSLLQAILGKKSKEKGPAKAAKCDMCAALPAGPACVRACPTGAAMRVNPRKLLKILEVKQGAMAE